MNRDTAGRASLIAAIMVGAGALLSGLINFLMMLSSVPTMPRTFFLQDPVGWALTPQIRPLAVISMVVALLLLVGLTWLFVRLVLRSALPGRAAAVFFGTWGAIIIAGWVSGIVRVPLMIGVLQLPTDRLDSFAPQLYQFATIGATWALGWGWATALVVSLIHRTSRGGTAEHGFSPSVGDHATAYSPVGDSSPQQPPVAPIPPLEHPQERWTGYPPAQV
ncbi:hypothetical protein [Microbacterium sp.]|uniref:hypothetical protein n=1 Tax=Microbacterium sp. TaxID=51671 RepID=UPI002810FA2C|nr:hypothetical protein [Microbacterium sp.]